MDVTTDVAMDVGTGAEEKMGPSFLLRKEIKDLDYDRRAPIK